jgi:hypothetical protein
MVRPTAHCDKTAGPDPEGYPGYPDGAQLLMAHGDFSGADERGNCPGGIFAVFSNSIPIDTHKAYIISNLSEVFSSGASRIDDC